MEIVHFRWDDFPMKITLHARCDVCNGLFLSILFVIDIFQQWHHEQSISSSNTRECTKAATTTITAMASPTKAMQQQQPWTKQQRSQTIIKLADESLPARTSIESDNTDYDSFNEQETGIFSIAHFHLCLLVLCFSIARRELITLASSVCLCVCIQAYDVFFFSMYDRLRMCINLAISYVPTAYRVEFAQRWFGNFSLAVFYSPILGAFGDQQFQRCSICLPADQLRLDAIMICFLFLF